MSKATDPPLISVISITLNDHDGLRRTIESVQAQVSAPRYEHIIIDGVSDYDVASLLADLRSDAQLHQGEDQGLYDAMNTGTERASGEYLIYLNSGDTFAEPEVLAKIGALLTAKQPDFLYGDSLELQLDGQEMFKLAHSHRNAPARMFTHHQSMVFSHKLIADNRLSYNLSYSIAADYDFVLHVLNHATTILRLPGVIAKFSAGGVSQIKHHQGRREQFLVRKTHFDSSVFAARIFVMQTAARLVRSLSPKLYWRMRAAFGAVFR